MAFEMNDRLAALRHQNRRSDYIPPDPPAASSEQREEISQSLASFNEISAGIEHISSLIEDVRQCHEMCLASVQFQDQSGFKIEDEKKTEEIKILSKKLYARLKAIQKDLQEGTRNGADYRIRKAQYTTTTRRFRDVMKDYDLMMDDYREKTKDRIQRQLKYAGRTVDEEQLEQFLETDNPQIFTQNIAVETAQRRQALGEVEARHFEILRLEGDIRELYDLFYDMAILVEEQGDLVDVIERNVEAAALHVNRGQNNLQKAVVYNTSARRKRICICIIVFVISIILVLALVVVIAVLAALLS